jgi:hypothetical protein
MHLTSYLQEHAEWHGRSQYKLGVSQPNRSQIDLVQCKERWRDDIPEQQRYSLSGCVTRGVMAPPTRTLAMSSSAPSRLTLAIPLGSDVAALPIPPIRFIESIGSSRRFTPLDEDGFDVERQLLRRPAETDEIGRRADGERSASADEASGIAGGEPHRLAERERRHQKSGISKRAVTT